MLSMGMIEKWLALNVRKYAHPELVILDHFGWPKPDIYRGSFSAVLGGGGSRETFGFYADAAGDIQLQFPLFVSPLGVPASYIAIRLQPETEAAVRLGIRSVVPNLKPFGICPDTQQHITQATPDAQRAARPIDEIRSRLQAPGFHVRVDTATQKIQVGG